MLSRLHTTKSWKWLCTSKDWIWHTQTRRCKRRLTSAFMCNAYIVVCVLPCWWRKHHTCLSVGPGTLCMSSPTYILIIIIPHWQSFPTAVGISPISGEGCCEHYCVNFFYSATKRLIRCLLNRKFESLLQEVFETDWWS